MSSSRHIKRIRQIAAARGADPLMALRAAEAAVVLQRRVPSSAAVIWPEGCGGIAWEALAAESRNAGKKTESDLMEIRVVFGPDGPANLGLWKDITAALAGRSAVLALSLLEQGGPGLQPEPSPDQPDNRLVVRLLRGLLERIGPSPSPSPEISPRDSDLPDDRLILADAADTDTGLRLGPAAVPMTADLPDGFFLVDGRTPLEERLAAAEVLSLAGLVPVVPLAEGEAAGSVETAARMAASGAPLALMFTAPWSSLSRFAGIEGLSLLSPGSAEDTTAAVAWVGESGSAAVILDTGDDAHPERKAFGQSWETGRGVVVRESRKGSAGRILLIAPGRSAAVASRAADRLVKDNISVTVLSMRFLSPLDTRHLESLIGDADVAVVVEETGFPGDLRSRILRQVISSTGGKLLMAPDRIDGARLASMASGELREQRIRRTVDDVKADRWR